MNIANINKLADLIETRLDIPFNMNLPENCLCGWAAQFFNKDIQEVLELENLDLLNELIMPFGWSYTDLDYYQYSRQEVARVLRHLAKTGEVVY